MADRAPTDTLIEIHYSPLAVVQGGRPSPREVAEMSWDGMCRPSPMNQHWLDDLEDATDDAIDDLLRHMLKKGI